MPTPTSRPVALIDQMAAEWNAIGRSPSAVRPCVRRPTEMPASRLVLGTEGARRLPHAL